MSISSSDMSARTRRDSLEGAAAELRDAEAEFEKWNATQNLIISATSEAARKLGAAKARLESVATGKPVVEEIPF